MAPDDYPELKLSYLLCQAYIYLCAFSKVSSHWSSQLFCFSFCLFAVVDTEEY